MGLLPLLVIIAPRCWGVRALSSTLGALGQIFGYAIDVQSA
jgi:hypothetical protein